MKYSLTKILGAGFLVGTIDILSAFVWYYIKTGKTNFPDILKFIASGLFGKETAYGGGIYMVLAGLSLHYFIAFMFTIFFFFIFPRIFILSKNRLVTAVIYGLFIWAVMNLVVVRLSRISPRPFNLWNECINALILIIGIGMPLTFIASANKNSVRDYPLVA